MTAGRGGKSSRTKGLSATDHQEIEWQFDAGELESVEGWLGRQYSGSSGLIVAPESTLEITDTYYDTGDWRFYRAGYALRVRKTGNEVESTMKSLTPSEGNVRRRREICGIVADHTRAAAARERIDQRSCERGCVLEIVCARGQRPRAVRPSTP